MIRGFYTAKTGMQNMQNGLNVCANNIANVNTSGFRASKVSFKDLIYKNINSANAQNPIMQGHGVNINKTDLSITQGAFVHTMRNLDFVLEDENTFFAIKNEQGDIEYTKNGNFILSSDNPDGKEFFLAASNGDKILDKDEDEIKIKYNNDDEIEFNMHDIGVFVFENPYGLRQIGNSRFIPSENSGKLTEVENPKILSGYLENSNVDISREMVKVIEYSKAFAFNSRIVQTADEIEKTINSLR